MNITIQRSIYYHIKFVVMIIAGTLLMWLGAMWLTGITGSQTASAMYIIEQAPSNPLAKEAYTNCLENKLKTEKYINEGNVWDCRNAVDAVKQTKALEQLKKSIDAN